MGASEGYRTGARLDAEVGEEFESPGRPTMQLRWSKEGALQQAHEVVRQRYDGRDWHPIATWTDWRDVPKEGEG